MASVPDHHSHTGLLTPPLGNFSTTKRMMVPSMMGSWPSWSSHVARRVNLGCSLSHAGAVAFP